MTDLSSIFGDVIHAYTRADALRDGALIDVSTTAAEAGFKTPVAVTAGVWGACIKLTPAAERACNDEAGRLWDVLSMARFAARRARDANEVLYEVMAVVDGPGAELVQLKLHIGPGDSGEPVITILLPDED